MKLRILLINPWIYDFAAANVWSAPLGLLRVAESLSLYDVQFACIDCMESLRPGQYGKGKYRREIVERPDCLKNIPRRFGRYGISIDAFMDTLKQSAPFDLVLITSLMSWWYPGVQKAIACIREVSGNVPVILGGIYATLWHGHAVESSGADLIFRGQVGRDLVFGIETFGFRLKRVRDDEVPYYRLTDAGNHAFAPLLTGRGCPFACDYCGSGLLQKGFSRRTPEGVLDEISELYHSGVRDFAFYDDALLVDAASHIKVILREIVKRRMEIRFHCPNGLHARFIDDELALLLKEAGFMTLRLGLETVNQERQERTGGKVTSGDLGRAVGILKKYGFTKDTVGVYLMYGLPGQGFDEIREGVAFLKSLGVRICLTEFSPVPGTKCWDELVARGSIQEKIDPLLTNNSVFSFLFSGYDPDELTALKLAVKDYNIS